jgi:hypothetical protein
MIWSLTLQVVYSVIHWLCTWFSLQKAYAQALVLKVVQQLMQAATNFSPWHMGDDLVSELMAIRVLGFFSLALCLGKSQK